MTVEQFKEALAERDEKVAEDFEQFIKDYGFDKVPANLQTANELLEEIKNKIADKSEYAGQLDRVIAFLEKLDLNDAEQLAKLDEIVRLLENFKCGCEHDNQDQTDESVSDLEDMFG